MDESFYRFELRIPRPTKRWFRFSLLSLLVLITGVCLVLGLWPQHGDRKLHTIQLQQLPARIVAEFMEELQVIGADNSKSKAVIGIDRSKPTVEVDDDTNSNRLSTWSVADVIKKLQQLVYGRNASKSQTVTLDDGRQIDVDTATNTIRFLANEAELKNVEELLLKLGEGPNPPAPQRELPPKSKFRLLSHHQASATAQRAIR
jgi:hypothetical protein